MARRAARVFHKLWVAAMLRPRSVSALMPRFSNAFQSHMVLQRGRPITLWGFGAEEGKPLTVALGPTGESTFMQRSTTVAGADGRWEVLLPALPETAVGLSMKLTLTSNGTNYPSQELLDVTLGDVYLFTGQSNVDLPESYALQFHAASQQQEEEFAEEMGRQGLIRVMIVPNQLSGLHYGREPAPELTDSPDCGLCPPPFGPDWKQPYKVCHCNSLRWSRASAASMRGFSALGWFSGAALRRSLTSLAGVPLGLVRSSWGGTKIYRWSGPDAMARCPQGVQPRLMPSDLFSNMIFPLARLQLSAVVWMHGASDTGGTAAYVGPKYYSCALPAMIGDWRKTFRHESLPFIVVELPAYCNERDWATFHTFCDQKKSELKSTEYHLPSMRIAQAAAEKMRDVYMVTAMDLGSLHPLGGSIHSDRKEELGMRVALAARAAVYQDSKVIWQAPTAMSARQLKLGHISVYFSTRLNEFLVLNTSAGCPPEVLPIYCTGGGFEIYSNSSGWVPAASAWLGQDTSVVLRAGQNGSVERVRYAFADWPVCSLRSAVTGLPARIFDLAVDVPEVTTSPNAAAFLQDAEKLGGRMEQQVGPVLRNAMDTAKERGEEGLKEAKAYAVPRWQIISLVIVGFFFTICVIRHALKGEPAEAKSSQLIRTGCRARVLEVDQEEGELNTKGLLSPKSSTSETTNLQEEAPDASSNSIGFESF